MQIKLEAALHVFDALMRVGYCKTCLMRLFGRSISVHVFLGGR